MRRAPTATLLRDDRWRGGERARPSEWKWLLANSTVFFDAPTAHGASGKTGKNVTYPTWQVWRKPLEQPAGAQAVLLINLSDEPQDVSFEFEAIDPLHELGDKPTAIEVWSGDAVKLSGNRTGEATFEAVAAHDSVFLIISPTRSRSTL